MLASAFTDWAAAPAGAGADAGARVEMRDERRALPPPSAQLRARGCGSCSRGAPCWRPRLVVEGLYELGFISGGSRGNSCCPCCLGCVWEQGATPALLYWAALACCHVRARVSAAAAFSLVGCVRVSVTHRALMHVVPLAVGARGRAGVGLRHVGMVRDARGEGAPHHSLSGFRGDPTETTPPTLDVGRHHCSQAAQRTQAPHASALELKGRIGPPVLVIRLEGRTGDDKD